MARSPAKVVKSNNNSNISAVNKVNGQIQQIAHSQLLQQQHNYSELNNNSNGRFNQNQSSEEMRKRAQTLQSLSSGSER